MIDVGKGGPKRGDQIVPLMASMFIWAIFNVALYQVEIIASHIFNMFVVCMFTWRKYSKGNVQKGVCSLIKVK